MFTKILLCTDLSGASAHLVECTGQLKALGVKEVVLAHILYVVNTTGLDSMLAQESEPLLAREKKILEEAGLSVQTEMIVGKPAYTLDMLADKHEVSLVVIGSHGRGFLNALVLGSVSEKLLQLTRRPVLLARNKIFHNEKESLAQCDQLFTHLLFPTDFSEASEMAFGCLEQLAGRTKAAVTLMTVRSASDNGAGNEQLCRIDMARLTRMQKSLEEKGAAKVEILCAKGNPAAEIVAAGKNCSLIVMGTHGKGLLEEAVLGSCAHEVARQAETPILFASSPLCGCCA